jgi:hypothetical protein
VVKHPVHEAIDAPLFTRRFVVAIVLAVVGLAWIAYYYWGARAGSDGKDHGLGFVADLGNWNYLIGFVVFFVGLIASAHPDTPLGRGRGVVTTMLTCFLIGLAWVVVFYIFSSDQLVHIPVFNDLGQKNLLVGIAFMAVGFAFATRWE